MDMHFLVVALWTLVAGCGFVKTGLVVALWTLVTDYGIVKTGLVVAIWTLVAGCGIVKTGRRYYVDTICLTVPTKMSRETVLSMLINIIHIIPPCPNFVVS